MQLTIKNFGPIKKGEIDLSKKFYVFVGYNNSGKTYVSQLLWALCNAKTIRKFSQSKEIEGLSVEDHNRFEITQNLIDDILNRFSAFLTTKVVPEIFNVSKDHFILNNFSVTFALELNEIRDYTGKLAIQSPHVGETNLNRFFLFNKQKDSFVVEFEEQELPERFEHFSVKGLPDFEENQDAIKTSLFVVFVLTMVFKHIHEPFFLPSNRLIYLVFYQYLYSVEKEKRQKISKLFGEFLEKKERGEQFNLESLPINAFKSVYTEPMDFLFDKIYELNENPTANSYYDNIIAELTKILGGDIVMHKSLGIAPLEFYLKMLSEELEIYLSSSSVNQLSTLYLYLKYWASEENNFLLIDEQEENLHPRNQIALCNMLLKFVRHKNNRVLINTHSPLIAENVNHYMYLHILSTRYGCDIEDILDDNALNLRADISISQDELGVYFFNGKEIINYEAEDYGVYFRDFQKVNHEVEKKGRILTDYIYLKEHQNENVFDK
jgi:AAA15 family ATPase/GTPase